MPQSNLTRRSPAEADKTQVKRKVKTGLERDRLKEVTDELARIGRNLIANKPLGPSPEQTRLLHRQEELRALLRKLKGEKAGEVKYGKSPRKIEYADMTEEEREAWLDETKDTPFGVSRTLADVAGRKKK